jgi:hypothetical protein
VCRGGLKLGVGEKKEKKSNAGGHESGRTVPTAPEVLGCVSAAALNLESEGKKKSKLGVGEKQKNKKKATRFIK